MLLEQICVKGQIDCLMSLTTRTGDVRIKNQIAATVLECTGVSISITMFVSNKVTISPLAHVLGVPVIAERGATVTST